MLEMFLDKSDACRKLVAHKAQRFLVIAVVNDSSIFILLFIVSLVHVIV